MSRVCKEMLAVPFRKIDYSCNQILNLSFCIGSPSYKAHLNLTSVWQLISLGICQIIRHLIFQCWLPLESLLKVVNSPKIASFIFLSDWKRFFFPQSCFLQKWYKLNKKISVSLKRKKIAIQHIQKNHSRSINTQN